MNRSYYIFKILLIILIFFNIPLNSFSEPLQNLIYKIQEYTQNPALRTLNYNDSKYQRSNAKRKLLNQYKLNPPDSRMLLTLIRLYTSDLKLNEEDLLKYKNSKPISPQQIYNNFFELKQKGETLKTGDLFFILPQKQDSFFISKMLESPYSHVDLIWIIDDIPHCIVINSQIDFEIIPLVDLLFPFNPKNLSIAIYRYSENLDIKKSTKLLKTLDNQKKKFVFDPYFYINPPIKDINNYLDFNYHIYCYEFAYLFYQYMTNKNDFISPFRLNSVNIIRMIRGPSPFLEGVAKRIDKHLENINNFYITANNFIQSKYFKPLLIISNNGQTD
ncbi:hypothetical protein BVX93_00960 [bacterium B13(2017)]|nr:hypothetical protein BVX93_00960 [bacterium B13(2017)]